MSTINNKIENYQLEDRELYIMRRELSTINKMRDRDRIYLPLYNYTTKNHKY